MLGACGPAPGGSGATKGNRIMNTTSRRLAVILAALSILVLAAAPSAAREQLGTHELRRAARAPGDVGISPAPCEDRAFRLLGAKWVTTYEWSFRASSTPSYLSRRTTKDVLKRSFNNVTNGRNDCGRADNIDATQRYLGTTPRSPNCSRRDGRNVIGFARLPYGVLAVTCYWMRNGRMVEADLKINTREMWSLSGRACRARPVLEATMTHEAGHVFGLDHVGERKHGRLTMSSYLDGPCQNAEATLGLGDLLGLERLY